MTTAAKPTTGKFRISFNGHRTADIAWATASGADQAAAEAAVKAALEAIATVGTVSVARATSGAGWQFSITFQSKGYFGPVPSAGGFTPTPLVSGGYCGPATTAACTSHVTQAACVADTGNSCAWTAFTVAEVAGATPFEAIVEPGAVVREVVAVHVQVERLNLDQLMAAANLGAVSVGVEAD